MFKRIIIVDDEAAQRNGLKMITKGICPKAEVLSANNGSEALGLLYAKPAEVILSDIRMPIMDGIELLQEVAQHFPRTKFILVSAYQDFEYAKAAIQYHAVDYLVKPFRVSNVRELFDKVARELEIEEKKEIALSTYNKLSEDLQKQEDIKNLQNLLLGHLLPAKREKLRCVDRLGNFGVIVRIRWESMERKGSFTLEEALLERMLPPFIFINDINPINEATLLIPLHSASTIYHELEEFATKIEKEFGIIFYAGVSKTASCLLEEASEAFSQACESLSYYFYYPQSKILLYEKLYNSLHLSLPYLKRAEQKIRDAIYESNIEAINQEIRNLHEEMRHDPPFYPAKVKHRISSLVVSIVNGFEGAVLHQKLEELRNTAYQKYSECNSFEALFSTSRELILSCIQLQDQISSVQNQDLIDSCIAYLEENLTEELSLNEVADRFHFNPNYLSALIKKKTGLSYSAYLLSNRMKMARNLLLKSNEKIKDIACRVGFRDGSYFTRVFRRENGMSPEQYRRKYNRW